MFLSVISNVFLIVTVSFMICKEVVSLDSGNAATHYEASDVGSGNCHVGYQCGKLLKEGRR